MLGKLRRTSIVAVVGVSLLLVGFYGLTVHASSGTNSQMSFTGKIVKSDGTNVPDGTYNIEFKIYQDGTSSGSGSTLKWTEDRLVSATNGVVVSGGTFSVNLGSVTSFGNNVDWNQDTLWLSFQLGDTSSCTISTSFQTNCGGDGEMTPYIRLTSVPYAQNANRVGGLTVSSLAQLSPGSQQSGFLNVSGNITSGATIQGSTINATTGFSLSGTSGSNTTCSSGNILQNATVAGGIITGGTCTTNGGSLQTAYNIGNTITETAGTGINITSSTNVPTVDQLSIDNTSSTGVATNNANALAIHYKGGTTSTIEAAGMRIDYTPGTGALSRWSGLRIVESTSALTGVTSYGLKLEGGTGGSGVSYGVEVSTGWDIGVDVQSGGLQLASQSDPVSPAATSLRIYATTVSGRVMPAWLNAEGAATPFQSNLGFNRVAMMLPSNSTVPSAGTLFQSFGASSTNSASAYATPSLASTNILTATRRQRMTSTTVAGNIIYHAPQNLLVWRGGAAGLGGFFFTTRFNFSTLQSGNRAFIGLIDSTSTPTNIDPRSSTTDGKLGIAINSNTGNLHWINNRAGNAMNDTDLGSNFPVNTTDLFELVIYSPPNGSTTTYRLKDLSTGTSTGDVLVSSGMPTQGTFLAPEYWMTNNATAAAVAMDCAGWYLESDY